MVKIKSKLKLILSLYIAFVLVQSLFFKFTGSPETNYIFSTLGAWAGFPWFSHYGGYMVGVVELVASVLLFTRLHVLGAIIALGVITGAIFFHLFTPLGVIMPTFNGEGEVTGNDSGVLFIMACFVWVSALALIINDYRSETGTLHRLLK